MRDRAIAGGPAPAGTTISSSSRCVTAATSATAASNTSALARLGTRNPLIFRTYCLAAASTSDGVAASSPRNVTIDRHMAHHATPAGAALASPPMKVTVLGAGSWGTTVASLVAGKSSSRTTLWARNPDVASAIDERHVNPDYLPDFQLSPELRATADLEQAVGDADIVIVGIPTQGFRQVLVEARPYIRPWIPIVSLSKGFEAGTLLRMTEIIKE